MNSASCCCSVLPLMKVSFRVYLLSELLRLDNSCQVSSGSIPEGSCLRLKDMIGCAKPKQASTLERGVYNPQSKPLWQRNKRQYRQWGDCHKWAIPSVHFYRLIINLPHVQRPAAATACPAAGTTASLLLPPPPLVLSLTLSGHCRLHLACLCVSKI